jgi:hypothetical protein
MTGKQFSDEEDRIYRKSIEMIRSSIGNGVKFDAACEFITADKELKDMIVDDALKIEIAELHYGKNLPLIEVSKKLGVAMERLLEANNEMMEDVMNTTAEASGGPSGNPTIH